MLEVAGYLSAILIGVSLGLIGGGGSILTVPALVYLMGVPPVEATAYSLFIVGMTSLVGGIQKHLHQLVNMRAAIIFGIPSIVSVYLTRKFLVPALPDNLFTAGSFLVTKDIFIMLLFAILMVLASASMIMEGRKNKPEPEDHHVTYNIPLIIVEGIVVGAFTGLVGAGGGFLIIPALVLLMKLKMKTAVGTSLIIIAAKSLIGFTGDLTNMIIDWKLLGIFSVLAVAGIFAGNKFSHGMESGRLKKWFGWFVLVMGIYIILRETNV
jgi:uncharacterized protein